MILVSILIYFCLWHQIRSLPNINLHLTDWNKDDDDDNSSPLQHNCLYVTNPIENEKISRQIMFYCLSEWPSKWDIKKNNHDEIFTFDTLYRLGVTSLQLYIWSAPIDIIENYTYYSINAKHSNDLIIDKQVFYNCTSPRFGPMCQYSFDDYKSYHSSLNEIIDYSYIDRFELTTLTCYNILPCNRGASTVCLDWSEICDGKIDCVDGAQDEENCWQIEINECNNDEYRCANGQCIPDRFFRDDYITPDCLDASDEIRGRESIQQYCAAGQPLFGCEDVACTKNEVQSGKPFSSSCAKNRMQLILEAIMLEKPSSINETCWSSFLCIFRIKSISSFDCRHCRLDGTCEKVLKEDCPYLVVIPNNPLFFGNIYFGYTNNESTYHFLHSAMPQYICYKEPICEEIFMNNSSLSYNNLTCRLIHPAILHNPSGRPDWISNVVISSFERLWSCNPTYIRSSEHCNRSNAYRCLNSDKCILEHRITDFSSDCYYADDEVWSGTNRICENKTKYYCESTNKCIPLNLVQDDVCHCVSVNTNLCEDESIDIYASRRQISFQTICDGFTELTPVSIDGQNETDETNCIQYPCNNTYTRCDGLWNCLNGADEIDCDPSPLIVCPRYHHTCVLPDTNQLTCLHMANADDGNIDCLGATDEPRLCRSVPAYNIDNKFHCRNSTRGTCLPVNDLCSNHEFCKYGDDRKFCYVNATFVPNYILQADENKSLHNDAQKFIFTRLSNTRKRHIVHFMLSEEKHSIDEIEIDHQKPMKTTSTTTFLQREQPCLRGIKLIVWLDVEKKLTTSTCLCPPSFYGNYCQYQNQRVSFTLSFSAFSDSWQIPFLILILLIDNANERTIHSYEQLTYLPIQDCKIKYNFYLLYAIRPKKMNPSFYSIHIDVFEKISLKYRGSLLLPLNYTYLPVHRVAVDLIIPRVKNYLDSCSDQQCINGQCTRYAHSRNNTRFCRCHQGWSGRYCTIQHNCTCSLDSLCIGNAANKRSICVCPIGKFGYRCLLSSSICQKDGNNPCKHGGHCIPTEENNFFENKFLCICRKGFTGVRCEIPDVKLIVSFQKDIIHTQTMIIHFIEVIHNRPPNIANTLKPIPFDGREVIIYWSRPFHIVFVEINKRNYHLLVVQTTYNRSVIHTTMVEPSNRCKHISELFNKTIVESNLLRRIKLYHRPCQNRSQNLSCFYDDIHFCLCENFGEQRLVNCLQFNHEQKLDCFGQSGCENGAQCFQDNKVCPRTSTCVSQVD